MSLSSTLARVVFNTLQPFGRNIKRFSYVDIKWIDEYERAVSGVLRAEKKGLAYGPIFFEKEQKNVANVIYPPVRYFLFDDAEVSGSSSSVLVNRDLLLIERLGTYNPKDFDFSAGHILFHQSKSALIRKLGKSTLINGIFLGGNGSFNYYHWLIEIIPKLEFLKSLPEICKDYPLLVPEEITKFPSFYYFLEKVEPNRELVILKNNCMYAVDHLVYITSANNIAFNLRPGKKYQVSHVLINPESLRFLRQKFLTEDLTNNLNNKFPKKIFLKRRQERRIYNQDEIEALLSTHGYVSIYMEDLPVEDQIRTVYNAESIIGPTGAAWSNIVFCKENTRALCWMAEELNEFSAFSTLAGHLGVHLTYVQYKTGYNSTAEQYYADYNVDLKVIERYLEL